MNIYMIVWLAFLVSGVLGWYFYNKVKLEEKKLRMEHGLDPEDPNRRDRRWHFPWLKLGIVVISLGVGLLLIALMVNYTVIGHSDGIYPAILCICGGLGLVIAHFVPSHHKKEQ